MESNVIEKTISVTSLDVTGEVPVEGNESSRELEVLAGREMYKGDPGASAYEVAVANGFEGTETEWLESLNGRDGKDGAVGRDGVDGYTPIKGVDYFDGKDGKDGVDGKDGYTPQKGIDYFDGKDGKDGVDGRTPVKGVDYFDGEKGDKGDPGYTPVKGKDYFDGSDGQDGYTPVKGKDYFDGKDGEDGYTPVKGVDYFDGQDGKDGTDGKTPIKGVDYFDGKNGSDGKDGTSPTVSVTAITGGHRISITDANGTKTVDVMDGLDGAAGSPGKDGSNGSDGKDGNDGVGIASIKQTTTSTADDGNNIITVTLTNGQTATFTVQNGSKGSAGKDGVDGKDGSDANVTATNIKSALGYDPAKQTDVESLSEEIANKAGLPYFVCSTAADTAAKTIDADGFELKEGMPILVKFTNANSVASPTLNIGGTGAKPLYRYGTTAMSTGTTTTGWVAGAIMLLIYDGTGWIRDYWNNTTYSNVALGQGYVTCSTAEATTAKVGTLSSYTLTANGIVSVKFTNAVPAGATLNINSKGAKAMYFRGAAITAGVIKAGDVATFIYNTNYHLISIDRWQNDIEGLAEEISGLKNSGTGATEEQLAQIQQNKTNISRLDGQIANLSQGTPPYAESLDWLNANGNTNKLYLLPNGNLARYTESAVVEVPTNFFNPSTATLNKRPNSSGGLSNCTGVFSTDFIPVTLDGTQVLTMNGAYWAGYAEQTSTGRVNNIVFYTASKTVHKAIQFVDKQDNGFPYFYVDSHGNFITTIGKDMNGNTITGLDYSQVAYIRVASSLDANGTTPTANNIANVVMNISNMPNSSIIEGGGSAWLDTEIKYANYALTEADKESIAQRLLDILDVSYIDIDNVVNVGTYTLRYDGVENAEAIGEVDVE